MKKKLLIPVSLILGGAILYFAGTKLEKFANESYPSSNESQESAKNSSSQEEITPDRYVASEGTQTVCTMTINSDDEKKTFTNYLSKDSRYKFVELVTKEDNWFDQACRSNVQCDMLIVSGHFGGTFFGSSGKSLSLSEMETKSCTRKCNGILENPKEVFLFGCNTLASKLKDSRTPEEYLQVLIGDGIQRELAIRVVESRYGISGEDNANRMRRVFAGVPRIYGFSSVGPKGEYNKPVLEQYLSNKANGYFSYIENLESVKKNKQPYAPDILASLENIKLTSLYKDVSNCFTQTSGADGNDDIANKICQIRNSSNPIEKRANYLNELMSSEKRLSYIELCNDFFQEIKGKPLSPNEASALNKIKNNDTLKTELLNVIGSVNFFFGYQYGSLAIELGAPRTTVVPVVSAAFAKTMNEGATVDKYDVIHSLSKYNTFHENLDLKFDMFKPEIWKNGFAVASIGLTQTKDQKIIDMIISLIESGSSSVQSQAAFAVADLHIKDLTTVKKLISGLSGSSTFVKTSLLSSLGQIGVYDESVVSAVIKTLATDSDGEVRAAAAFTLGVFKNIGDAGQNQLATTLKDSFWKARSKAAEALANIDIKNESIHYALLEALGDSNDFVKSSCERALRISKKNFSAKFLNDLKAKYPNIAGRL